MPGRDGLPPDGGVADFLDCGVFLPGAGFGGFAFGGVTGFGGATGFGACALGCAKLRAGATGRGAGTGAGFGTGGAKGMPRYCATAWSALPRWRSTIFMPLAAITTLAPTPIRSQIRTSTLYRRSILST